MSHEQNPFAGYNTLIKAYEAAEPGPFLETEIVPLVGVGKIRVTYNWLYSALNCDPSDNSSFIWQIDKLSNTKVSMSPKNEYAGMKLYASVRPDWDYFVQVQAPFSADWVTLVQADEEINYEPGDLLTASFKGLNGDYLSVNSSATSHDNHTGYKIQSNASATNNNSIWFLGVTANLQATNKLPLKSDITELGAKAIMEHHSLPASNEDVLRFMDLLRAK